MVGGGHRRRFGRFCGRCVNEYESVTERGRVDKGTEGGKYIRKEYLSKHVVQAPKLELGRKVCINPILTHKFVMVYVISLRTSSKKEE
jgi:hypothetical protein